jgi:hypothetical protein
LEIDKEEKMNSIRDEIKDAIQDELAGYHGISFEEVDSELVGVIADSVFDVLGIT